MTLPPKALNVLVDLKRELLAREAPFETAPGPLVEVKASELPQGVRAESERKTPERTIRHARVKGRSWQRFQRDMNERIGRAWA